MNSDMQNLIDTVQKCNIDKTMENHIINALGFGDAVKAVSDITQDAQTKGVRSHLSYPGATMALLNGKETTILYALYVFEMGYPCGSVRGIYSTEEEARKVVAELTEINKDNMGDVNNDECISFEVRGFEMNTLYRDGLNGCAECVTALKI